MKKRILSIILAIGILLSMSACSQPQSLHTTKSSEKPVSPKIPEISTLSVQVTERFNPWEIEDCLEKYFSYEEIENMSLEEVNSLAENLVYMTKTEYLSPQDMNDMGWMFHHIWYQCPEYDKSKLTEEIIEAFNNVYNHIEEIGLALDYFDCWLDTPVPEVMIKYISSSNFKEPFDVWGRGFMKLSTEDLKIVTLAFVNNPVMETNPVIARTIICSTDDEEISKLVWEHLIRLSKSTAFTEFTPLDRSYIYRNIFDDYDINYESDIILERIYSTEYIYEIAENILDNPSFEFDEKYEYFCSDFLSNSDLDVPISLMAKAKLSAI